ncbi:MAG: hypothetical protein P8Y94_12635 [Acidobacteriota bacterium]
MNLRVLKATLGTVLLFFAAALLCDSALAQMTSLEGTVRDPQQARSSPSPVRRRW